MSLPMIFGMVAFLALGVGFVYISLMPKKKRMAFFKNIYDRLFEFLSNFFLTRNSARKITHRISMLSIYRNDEIPMITVHYFMAAFLASSLMAMYGILVADDMVSKLLCILFSLIINTIMIDKQLDKTQLKVLKEMTKSLSSIEQEYMKSKNIPDALANAQVGKLLRKAIDDIYSILVGSGGELRLQQFYASMPFRPLQTLAGVCYNLNYYGDNIDNQNISGFVRALIILKSDVNAQIEKLALQKAKFGIMEYLPLVAIIGITPLENYFISVIPGVALMYNGLMGYILRAVVIIAAITAYTVISRINSTVTVKENDTGAWTVWLLRHKHWKRLISGLLPKNDKKRYKMEFKLKKALSKMKLEHYYTKKVIFSVIAFCGSLALLFVGCQLGRDYVKNSTAQLSLVAGVERTEKEQTAMRTMDEIFFAADGKLETLQHTLLIQKYLPGLSDMQMLDEMKRMQDKYDTWVNLYFKYPYVWIAFLLGLIGYGLPSLMIKARAFLVKTETEDDYMQLQTLVSILVYTGIDTLAVLQQMVQQSTVHKDILLYAYHSYPSAPELEMERLRTKITLSEFKWFIDKLKLTISELPMNEAFSDLITERENFMRLRHISMESTLAKKQFLCRIFAMAPVILFAVAEFMLPIGILGISEFQNALKML